MVFQATVWDESVHACSCCGKRTRTFWGDVSEPDRAWAVYYVHHTVGAGGHPPIIDVVLGAWGEEAGPEDRVAVSLVYKPGFGGGLSFIDAVGRPSDDRELCARALVRADVVGTPLAKAVFRMLDTVFRDDPRMQEIAQLGHALFPRALTGTSRTC